MKLLFPLLFSFVSVFGQTKLPLPSKIEKVTVFLSGAQVERSATLNLQAGKHEYLFSGLSPHLNQQTLQVSGNGDFTILAAVQRINYLKENETQQKSAKIQAKMDSIQQKIDLENVNLEVLKSEETLLDRLQLAQETDKMIPAADITEALNYREKKLTDLKLRHLKSSENISRMKEDYEKFYKQLVAAEVKQNTSTSELSVIISSPSVMNTSLTISYFVPKAGWIPFYDFRVKDISQPMTITHKANVFQQSGEDWNEVKLVLSNANPYQNNTVPILSTWRLYQDKDTRRLVGYSSEDADGDGVPDLFDQEPDTPEEEGRVKLKSKEDAKKEGYKIAKEQEAVFTIPLQISEKTQQTVFSYEIAEAYTVLADGKFNMVEIKSNTIPVHYQYFAIPKMQKEAFLLALIKDWENYNLLEGEANLFFEGTYIGTSRLDLSDVGDTLRVSLGKDKQVLVSRTRLKDMDSRQLLGNQQTANRSFEIAVRNAKKQAIEILIEDQFPLPAEKEIVVERLNFKEGKVNEETGKVQWLLKIAPSEEKKLPLKYAIKYPKNWQVDIE